MKVDLSSVVRECHCPAWNSLVSMHTSFWHSTGMSLLQIGVADTKVFEGMILLHLKNMVVLGGQVTFVGRLLCLHRLCSCLSC